MPREVCHGRRDGGRCQLGNGDGVDTRPRVQIAHGGNAVGKLALGNIPDGRAFLHFADELHNLVIQFRVRIVGVLFECRCLLLLIVLERGREVVQFGFRGPRALLVVQRVDGTHNVGDLLHD